MRKKLTFFASVFDSICASWCRQGGGPCVGCPFGQASQEIGVKGLALDFH
jgi:hypothetical protein